MITITTFIWAQACLFVGGFILGAIGDYLGNLAALRAIYRGTIVCFGQNQMKTLI